MRKQVATQLETASYHTPITVVTDMQVSADTSTYLNQVTSGSDPDYSPDQWVIRVSGGDMVLTLLAIIHQAAFATVCSTICSQMYVQIMCFLA